MKNLLIFAAGVTVGVIAIKMMNKTDDVGPGGSDNPGGPGDPGDSGVPVKPGGANLPPSNQTMNPGLS